ncbi:MAG: J domain-containing protein [Chloroflexota bacterium]
MPPRPSTPPDDLYARLEIATDASPEVIEVAWRSLLRLHHPDVAGPQGLERAKRINVAHDWLSDPALRDRYDRERGIRGDVRVSGVRAGGAPRGGAGADGADGRGRPGGAPGAAGAAGTEGTARTAGPQRQAYASRPRPVDPAEALAEFLSRVSALHADDIDRLACAEVTPIAFGATIARFLPPDRLAALEAMEAAVDARLDRDAAARPAVRDAVEGYGTELVLGGFLDDLLSEPFRERTRERLTRGWEAAVGQPRYGPNGDAVRALIERFRGLDAGDVGALAAIVPGSRGVAADDPWPPSASPDEDEALRVSSVLAARDAAASIPPVGDAVLVARARRSAARLAHLLVLRHAFAPASFASLTAPWRPRFLPEDQRGPRVRRPS